MAATNEESHLRAVGDLLKTLPEDSIVRNKVRLSSFTISAALCELRDTSAQNFHATWCFPPSPRANPCQIGMALREVEQELRGTPAEPKQPFFVAQCAAASSELSPRGPADMIALVVHAILRKSFVATSSEPVPGATSIPGFALPVRLQDLDPSRASPSGWQQEPGGDGCCCFTFRDSRMQARTLRSLLVGDTLVLHFGTGGGPATAKSVTLSGMASLELPVGAYVRAPRTAAGGAAKDAGPAEWLEAADLLEAKVVAALLPPSRPADAAAGASVVTQPQRGAPNLQVKIALPSHIQHFCPPPSHFMFA